MIILAAGTTGTVIATVVAFLVISLLLISILLFVKQKLSPSGPVKILINGEREIEVSSGGTLLSTLGNQKIFLHAGDSDKLENYDPPRTDKVIGGRLS